MILQPRIELARDRKSTSEPNRATRVAAPRGSEERRQYTPVSACVRSRLSGCGRSIRWISCTAAPFGCAVHSRRALQPRSRAISARDGSCAAGRPQGAGSRQSQWLKIVLPMSGKTRLFENNSDQNYSQFRTEKIILKKSKIILRTVRFHRRAPSTWTAA